MELEWMDVDDSGEHLHTFLVVEDPGPYPLMFEMELTIAEVFYGLLNGSFYPGTVLLDQGDGRRYTVMIVRQHLKLEPACDRLWLFAYHRRYITREDLLNAMEPHSCQQDEPIQWDGGVEHDKK